MTYDRLENEHELDELFRLLCDVMAYNIAYVTTEWVERKSYTALHVRYMGRTYSVHADNEHKGIYIYMLSHRTYEQHTAKEVYAQLKNICEW